MHTRDMWAATALLAATSSFVVLAGGARAEKPVPAKADVSRAMLQAERWTSADLDAVARFVDATQYIYVSPGAEALRYESGNPLLQLGSGYGSVLEVGGQASEGVFWNFSNDSAFLRVGVGPEVIELRPKSLMIVGRTLESDAREPSLTNALTGPDGEEIVTIADHTISTKCGAGFYACCKYNSGANTITAQCIANNSPNAPICDGGGPGSTECSITAP